jgi:hypothetical protein
MKGLVGARAKHDKVGVFCCSDSSRPTNNRQALKARRLKAQELATAPTPTCTLPNRPGHNVHPAGLPKFWCSKELIEAECEAKRKSLEEKTQKVRLAKEHLAHMNSLEESKDDLSLQHPLACQP